MMKKMKNYKLKTIPLEEKEIKDYLQKAVDVWREAKIAGDNRAKYYIDAYQSMYSSFFGETYVSKENK